MNISELSRMLADDCDSVARKIFPNGKREGAEWCVGSLGGEPGKSLKVRLSGSKRGIWTDFATGEAGDLVDLWREAYNLTMPEALAEIKNHLGVRDEREAFEKSYKTPTVPKCSKPESTVLHWLTEERNLTHLSINAYQVAESGNFVIFPFKFGDKLRMCKQRDVTDKKNQRPTSSDQEACLFGWQAIPDTQRVGYICEGELDAMALYEYDYPALSVPYGGGSGAKQGNWIENEYHNLERFDEVYLCLDSDEAGQDATKEIIKRLGAERCKVVTLPKKDANQCLIEGISQEEISKAIRQARCLDPEELKGAQTYNDKVVKLLHPDGSIEPGFFSPWAKARDLFYFRYNELSISNGVNGHGKSQIVGHIALSAMAQGERVCIASMELPPARLLARLARQAGGLTSGVPSPEYIGAISQWYESRLWVYECIGTAKTKRLLDTFLYARKRYGVRVFVVDSLMMCGIGEDDYNGQKAFVQQLCDFKNANDCHIFLVTHSRKGESEDKPTGKFDVKGTGAITDLADNVFTIWRNKKKERELVKPEHEQNQDLLNQGDALFTCHKQRNGDWEGSVSLWFEKCCFQYLPFDSAKPTQYVQFSAMDQSA
jgi:twinkle protein